ncbi:MAG: hypothetical protein RLZZ214_3211 [Verrucomicrobiota bacterium]|jgi:hypothetical protein
MILKTTVAMENHEQENARARFERQTEGLPLEEFDEYVDQLLWNLMPAEPEDNSDMQLPPWFATQILKRP